MKRKNQKIKILYLLIIQISYPENSFAIPEEHSFIPKCMSDDGKYLISYEIQENDENPVIILAEK